MSEEKARSITQMGTYLTIVWKNFEHKQASNIAIPLPKTYIDPLLEFPANLWEMSHLSKTALLVEFDTGLIRKGDPTNDDVALYLWKQLRV